MKYKVGDKVVFNHKTDGFLAVGVFTVTNTDTRQSTQCIQLGGYDTWFPSDRFLKVPLFKVGQIVIFKNIKDDEWYSAVSMLSLEGGIGIVIEVRENYYHADKPYQDGCQYKVKDLQEGGEWLVTSASLEPSPEMANIGTIDYYSKEDIIAATTTAGIMAQAVDNVKPKFKIGDTVVIRNDLVPGKNYIEWGGWNFLHDMAQHRGRVAKIIDYGCDDTNYLRLDIDDGKRSWITNSLLPYTPGSDYDLDKQTINQQTKQNYENQLQREKARISRGDKYTGRAVCSRGCKAQITVGHLSYKEVTQ